MIRSTFSYFAVCAVVLTTYSHSLAQDQGRVVTPPPVATADGVVQGPIPLNDQSQWVTSDDYPGEALRDLRSGITAAVLDVDATGTVTGCRVVDRSGSDALDRAACVAMQSRARFSPALDAEGDATASSYYKRVIWQIPEMAEPVPVEFGFRAVRGVIARIHYDSNGTQTQCRLEYVGGDAPASSENDLCTQFRTFPGSAREGMIGADGVWLELRQLGYLYDTAPRWAVRANFAPSEEPPPPLPPDAG